ncbi:MAG: BMP family ABC transporter substrate-binding protein [Bacillota bacterium]|nr:BMP family ABC transporter substrate-binding protein [Bacillota bacterium]
MKKTIAVLLSILVVFAFAGCGGPVEEQPEEQIDYEIALVTDSGLIMDGGYSEVAWNAITDFCSSAGVSHKYYKAAEASEKAYEETIENAVSCGAKVIIADGYSFEDVVYNSQKEYKDVDFILIDAEPVDEKSGETRIAGNTAVIHFASEQAGYLAGYAAVAEGASEIGFIGGARQPAIMDYGYGYLQGADAAAAELGEAVNVKYYYCTGEDERETIVKKATEWYKDNTEIIFACGSSVEQPVIEAAELTEGAVIACETDKSEMSDTVLTSAVKDISSALEEVLKQYKDDEFPGGTIIENNAENEGIGLEIKNSRLQNFSKSQYNSVFDKLASGDVAVKKSGVSLESLGLTNVEVIDK